MASRRTDVRYRLLMSGVQLILFVVFRHKAKQYADVDREDLTPEDSAATLFWSGASAGGYTARLSPTHLCLGVTKSVLFELLYDYDWWQIRRSRRKRFVLSVTYLAGYRYLVDQSPEAAHSHGFGESVGRILYRTRYGLLGEPLGEDEHTAVDAER